MIYSIGYGGRTWADILAMLRFYKIDYLVDVRRKAFCAWNADFNSDNLFRLCGNNEIKYVHKPELGGGKTKPPEYWIALNLLLENNRNMAIMCCEKLCFRCHRYLKIGRDLVLKGMKISHILDINRIYIQA